MADTVQFDLVSPERAMLSARATMVVAPGVEGDFAAMPGHAPFLTTLRPGVVTATLAGGKAERFVVLGGFAEVGPDRCTVLADDVHAYDTLDRALLDTRVADAEKALSTADNDSVARRAQRLNDLRTLRAQRFGA